jgi:ribosome-associated protein
LVREDFGKMPNVRIVNVKDEPLELNKLLKMESLVGSGGEAKYVIGEGLVRVNGVVETRKRKKIFSGDTVEFQGIRMRVMARQE